MNLRKLIALIIPGLGLAFLPVSCGGTAPEIGRDSTPHEVVDGAPGYEDPDQDHILGTADKCPNEPEDRDQFQDEDGCPDPDDVAAKHGNSTP